ncbi:MAG: hypothetical protein Q8R24_05320 [Legionellaceae bacterium]|nr:hypothetical protein [Legionellaceae bacterium]
MGEKSTESMDEDMVTWFSTYGLITVERIFFQLGLRLKQDEVMKAIHDSSTLHYQFLRVPFKTILNGIILCQATDYREYAQKTFIDFLLSGAANEEDEAVVQGSETREMLEQERLHLIEMGDEFDLQEFELNKLIAESQKALILLAKEMHDNPQEVTGVIINEQMSSFLARSQALNIILRRYRTHFYDLILRCRTLVETLPNYHPDPVKFMENRMALHFDSKLGDDKK